MLTPLSVPRSLYFYPRSPYGERRLPVGLNGAPCGHFYPRSPYGERLKSVIAGTFRSLISIHALLTESDPPVKTVNVRGHDFYPRSPYGERG